jgi:hypothetical protein
MTGLRHARALLTSLWLVMQTAPLISPSIVLLTAHEETTECTCAHGDHAICPMHHRPAPGSRICLMGSADNTLATLGSLFQAAALMPSVTSAPVPATTSIALINPASTITFRPVSPDPPPPRI